jgi:hypothetical protein
MNQAANKIAIREVKSYSEVDLEKDDRFRLGIHVYSSVHRTKTFLESLFRTEIVRAYSTSPTSNPKKDLLDWSTSHMALFFPDGGVIKMSNSEWAFFEEIREGKRPQCAT